MSLRGTLTRLERSLAVLRAAQPPWFQILEQHDGEADEAWRARSAEVRSRVEDVRATGRRAYVIVIDREEEPTP